MRNPEIVILGLGYIGLPTAALLSNRGSKVLGVDVNEKVVETINGGNIHIVEPDLEDIVYQSVKKGMLMAATEPTQADTYVIVVPTPFKAKNEPDISFVEAASKAVIPHLKKGDLFIIESTSPVGTTEKIMNLIFDTRPELRGELFIAYCPERVLPGNIMYELIHNDRVIGGINKESTTKAISFYKKYVKGQLHATNSRTAEMCKLVENSSRDVQIAFANELSLICDKANINVWELISLANKHPRVNILNPGSGVGGHCIAVDPYFIVSDYPLESQLISTARQVNNYKTFWCSEKIARVKLDFEIANGRKPKVALMGLAFKPNIDDLRESPANYIVQRVLTHSNNETHYIAEPNIKEHQLYKLTNYQEAYENADIIAYLVAHDEFKTLSVNNSSKIILDFCGVVKDKF